jgi:ribosomal protein S27AE
MRAAPSPFIVQNSGRPDELWVKKSPTMSPNTFSIKTKKHNFNRAKNVALPTYLVKKKKKTSTTLTEKKCPKCSPTNFLGQN